MEALYDNIRVQVDKMTTDVLGAPVPEEQREPKQFKDRYEDAIAYADAKRKSGFDVTVIANIKGDKASQIIY